MDDIVVIINTQQQARSALKLLEIFLNERLNLTVNSKTQIFPLSQGVNACGYKIHPTHINLRDGSKRAMKRRIKKMHQKYIAGEITRKQVQQAVDSWIGHANQCNSWQLVKKIFLPYKYITLNKKEGDLE
jgi:hypothetical protein